MKLLLVEFSQQKNRPNDGENNIATQESCDGFVEREKKTIETDERGARETRCHFMHNKTKN